MPRSAKSEKRPLPVLEVALQSLTVEVLKWYVAPLSGEQATRKGELVAQVVRQLIDPEVVRTLLNALTEVQRLVIAEVVYALDGVYDEDVVRAKYADAPVPQANKGYYAISSHWNNASKPVAGIFDLFFYHDSLLDSTYIPTDLAVLLRALLSPPPEPTLKSSAQPPKLQRKGKEIAVLVSETESAALHDLAAALDLVQQGKVAVSTVSQLPSLPTVRQLKERLLIPDYFPTEEYSRAEDAIRPLALVMLLQAARWAAPNEAGSRLDLTKAGQELVGPSLGAAEVKQAWERWLRSDVLDELSRVRGIKGQQAKGVHLSKPSSRRATLAALLRQLPRGQWVTITELLRYMRAARSVPQIERGTSRNLGVGYYSQSETWEYRGSEYDNLVVGSYLRAILMEYAATLGLLDIAYARAEEAPLKEDSYGFMSEPLGRYDGLLAIRLTNLGAFVLGLERLYTPVEVPPQSGEPVLRVLPNLDIVIIDAARLQPNDRAFLARVTEQTSEAVYHLNRESLLDAGEAGITLRQVRDFLTARCGQGEAELPQTVRVFFADLEGRLGALREAGRVLLLESDDIYLLTELSNEPTLRGSIRLATSGGRTVLLIGEADEAAVRRQLKKLGYLPRKA